MFINAYFWTVKCIVKRLKILIHKEHIEVRHIGARSTQVPGQSLNSRHREPTPLAVSG